MAFSFSVSVLRFRLQTAGLQTAARPSAFSAYERLLAFRPSFLFQPCPLSPGVRPTKAPGTGRPTVHKSAGSEQHSTNSPAASRPRAWRPAGLGAAPRDASSRRSEIKVKKTPQSQSSCGDDLEERPESPAASDPRAPSTPDRGCPVYEQRFLARATRSPSLLPPACDSIQSPHPFGAADRSSLSPDAAGRFGSLRKPVRS